MLLRHVTFEGTRPMGEDSRVRLDIACFLGFLTPRPDVQPAPDLRDWLGAQGYLRDAEKAGTTPISLINRPVPVRSLADVESYFLLDQRLDQRAELMGEPVVGALADLAPFAVMVDGVLHEVELASAASLQDVAARVGQVLPLLEVGVLSDRLRVALPEDHGPGTLSVLEHPALGFARNRQAAAQRVGTAMGAALRRFFRAGGREAVVVSMGDPAPVMTGAEARADALARLLDAGSAHRVIGPTSFTTEFGPPHMDAHERSGLTHLFGLEEVGLLVMPDLPDLTSADLMRADAPTAETPFAEFAKDGPLPSDPLPLSAQTLPLPACDAPGLGLWQSAMTRATAFLETHRRDVILTASLPQVTGGARLSDDLIRAPLVMLAAPFVRTAESTALPGGAMGADAVLAAHLARLENSPQRHGSMAVAAVGGISQLVGRNTGLDTVCQLEQGPRDVRFARDVTTDGAEWRAGPARRMMARLLKLAARLGDGILFEPISDELMRRVTASFTGVLQQMLDEGGLTPGREDPGFTVICDRSNNPEFERDLGRLRALVGFRPSMPIEMIHVSLPILPVQGQGGAT